MQTEELIETLVLAVRPVPRHFVERRIALGLIVGGAGALAVVITVLGIRPDIGEAVYGFRFWMKWIYTASLGGASIILIIKLARPTGEGIRCLDIMPFPVLLLTFMAGIELWRTPRADWSTLWLGHSWGTAPWMVFLLSLPVLIGLIKPYRSFAPTRLRLAGTAIGLTAGAWGAALYSLHCTEVSALFVVTWYSLGICLCGMVGMLTGPLMFRW